MAKNISLLGADYPDVPAVTLPQTGGGVATFIEESELGNTHVWVGTCDTAAATRDKAVTITGVTEYRTGDMFVVTFTNAQDYNGGPRLNVNGLGVKNIRRVVGSNAARYQWLAGETLAMVYNGTYMLLLNNGLASTTYYGLTKLSSSITATSSGIATTTLGTNRSMEMLTAMPVYDDTLTYSIGDRVRYSLGMYECNTAITTAEAWNADHWTQLPALQTQIDTLDSNLGYKLLGTLTNTTDTLTLPAGFRVAIFDLIGDDSAEMMVPFVYKGNVSSYIVIPLITTTDNHGATVYVGNRTLRITRALSSTYALNVYYR